MLGYGNALTSLPNYGSVFFYNAIAIEQASDQIYHSEDGVPVNMYDPYGFISRAELMGKDVGKCEFMNSP
jgi:hypothetical protein